jgi:hypothetical protein
VKAGGRFACWFLAELTSSALKMKAIHVSETSVDTQRTTWRYIPEGGILQKTTTVKTSNPTYSD